MKKKISILFIAMLVLLSVVIPVTAKGKYWKFAIGKVVVSNGFTFDELMSRNGKLYVEITTGTVVKKGGHGKENVPRGTQNYIKYPSKYKKGTKMCSLIVYNPSNNYTDDILYIYHMKR